MDFISWFKRVFSPGIALSQTSDRIDRLSSVLRKHKESKDRIDAAEELGRLRDPRTVEPLVIALRDVNWDVRMATARALAQIGDHSATEALVGVFLGTVSLREDQYGRSRWNLDPNYTQPLALALGQLGDIRALNPLLTYLRASNHMLKHYDRYRGTIFGGQGANLARLDALRAIVQFARSCRDIPQPEWKKIRVHIEEGCDLNYPGETDFGSQGVMADVELPVCADDSSDVAKNKVLLELAFPVAQLVQTSNIRVIQE
jgi:hypothetical protein